MALPLMSYVPSGIRAKLNLPLLSVVTLMPNAIIVTKPPSMGVRVAVSYILPVMLKVVVVSSDGGSKNMLNRAASLYKWLWRLCSPAL